MDLETGAEHPVAGDCRLPDATASLTCLAANLALWLAAFGGARLAGLW